MLKLLRAGNIRGAAKAHAEYVLDVRGAFEICNGRFASLREFYQGMEEEDE